MSEPPSKTSGKPATSRSERYVEPLPLYGTGLFRASDMEDFSPEFEALYKIVCHEFEQDRSPIGKAILRQEAEFRKELADAWSDYRANRQTESGMGRSACKPQFVELKEKAEALRTAILVEDPMFQRYFRAGLSRGDQGQEPIAYAERFEKLTTVLDDLIRMSDREIKIKYRTGRLTDKVLTHFCQSLRSIMEKNSGEKIPKSLKFTANGGFENAKVQLLYRIVLCIDPKVSQSKLQTVLRKTPSEG